MREDGGRAPALDVHDADARHGDAAADRQAGGQFGEGARIDRHEEVSVLKVKNAGGGLAAEKTRHADESSVKFFIDGRAARVVRQDRAGGEVGRGIVGRVCEGLGRPPDRADEVDVEDVRFGNSRRLNEVAGIRRGRRVQFDARHIIVARDDEQLVASPAGEDLARRAAAAEPRDSGWTHVLKAAELFDVEWRCGGRFQNIDVVQTIEVERAAELAVVFVIPVAVVCAADGDSCAHECLKCFVVLLQRPAGDKDGFIV